MCHQTPSHVMMFADKRGLGDKVHNPPFPPLPPSPQTTLGDICNFGHTHTNIYIYILTHRARSGVLHTYIHYSLRVPAPVRHIPPPVYLPTLHTTGQRRKCLGRGVEGGGPLQRDDDGDGSLRRCAVAHPKHTEHVFFSCSTVRLSMGKISCRHTHSTRPRMFDFQKWISVPPKGRRGGGGWGRESGCAGGKLVLARDALLYLSQMSAAHAN